MPALLLAICAVAGSGQPHASEALLRQIEDTVTRTESFTGLSALDPDVLEAMRRVPRREFVPEELRRYADLDEPLPIGDGQTISQPFIVALMTHLADVGEDDSVLEIGTGSGYQAAVLSLLAREVYTIEIIPSLGRRAAGVLERLGYDNVHVRIGDGYAGWPEQAPFQAIVVTAAPEAVPQPLIEQLAVGGRLVIPVGPQGRSQQLRLLVKGADGSLEQRNLLPVSFVPFTRDVGR